MESPVLQLRVDDLASVCLDPDVDFMIAIYHRKSTGKPTIKVSNQLSNKAAAALLDLAAKVVRSQPDLEPCG
jgi:hypothetical protein